MLLYHCTTPAAARSIGSNGILRSYCRGKRRAVWLCTGKVLYWAIEHVSARHQVAEEDVVAIAVRVPRGCLLRGPAVGLWYCQRDIGVEEFSAEHPGRARAAKRISLCRRSR